MNKSKIFEAFKGKILPISIIFILVYWIIYHKKIEESKLVINGIAKVYDSKVINVHFYYRYKYFYKNKLYKGDIEESEFEYDYNPVGRCFEVLINSDDPSKSKLNLKKELDCSIYAVTRKESEQSPAIIIFNLFQIELPKIVILLLIQIGYGNQIKNKKSEPPTGTTK